VRHLALAGRPFLPALPSRARLRRALHSFPTRRSSDLPLRACLCASAPYAESATQCPTCAASSAGFLRSVSQTPVAASHCAQDQRSEEHTSELQSRENLVCRRLLEKKKMGRELDRQRL